MSKVDFSAYKIGDKIWDSLQGEWVEIAGISNFSHVLYPIMIKQGGSCTFAGLANTQHRVPRYFHNEFKIPDEAFQKPLPDVKVDQPVWVKESIQRAWLPRHTTGMFIGDQLEVFCQGMTSHSQSIGHIATEQYTYWTLTDPYEAN